MPNFDVILTDAAPLPAGGFSQAIRYGNTIITSGFVGLHAGGGIVKGGFEAELRQCIHNIQAVLDAAGCTLHDVIRVNVMLTEMSNFAEMDRVYREYFHAPLPTRSVIGVKELYGGGQVDVEVWAIIRGK
ncbi:MAG: hypothetical protein RLZZ387_3509 [Chloroflexota bacterium]|jgi:2-iminobutanoate/2-iminopropanoate deaminase